MISVLNETRDRLVSENKENEQPEQENLGNKQVNSIKKGEKVEAGTSEKESKSNLGVTEHKTTLIIRQSSYQPSDPAFDQVSKSSSQDSLDRLPKGKSVKATSGEPQSTGKSGLKQEIADDTKVSPLGLPSMSQLEVEQTIMRSRSNSTDIRRLADIKKHKRSTSDIAIEKGSGANVTENVTGSVHIPASRGSKEISDFSDPLQDYQRSKDESIFYRYFHLF